MLIFLIATPLQAAEPCENPTSTTLRAGVDDDFGQPGEAPFQGAGLLAFSQGPWADFDYLPPNRKFGHTFQNLPCNIGSGTLTFHLRATSGLASNDTIGIQTTGSSPVFMWSRKVKDLLGQPWNTIGATATLTLDLTALPSASGGTVNVINSMNARGELDIYFQDDTAVDDIVLDLVTCYGTDCNNNGLPDACEDNPIVMNCPSTVNLNITDPSATCANTTISPTATDLCGKSNGITITHDYTAAGSTTAPLTACFPLGQTNVTFTATDARGNTETCVVTVVVLDKAPPVILSCPELNQ